MSHTATVDLELKDQGSLKKTVEDMGGSVEFADEGKKIKAKLYQGSKSGDMIIKLPGWNYPIVVDGGQAHYDNYNGRWGKQGTFDSMKQNYAANVATKKARRMGYNVRQATQKDGSIRLKLSR